MTRAPGSPVEHRRGERPAATPQIENVTVRWGESREHLDARRDHLVVVRDEAPDLDVIALSINAKMTLDRVRLTGQAVSVHVLPRAQAAKRQSRQSRARLVHA